MKISNVLFLIVAGLAGLLVLTWRLVTFGAGRALARGGAGAGGKGYCSYPVYRKSAW